MRTRALGAAPCPPVRIDIPGVLVRMLLPARNVDTTSYRSRIRSTLSGRNAAIASRTASLFTPDVSVTTTDVSARRGRTYVPSAPPTQLHVRASSLLRAGLGL